MSKHIDQKRRSKHEEGLNRKASKRIPWKSRMDVKTFLMRWARDKIGGGNDSRLIHDSNQNRESRWYYKKFTPFIDIMKEVYPDFYELCLQKCEGNISNISKRLADRHYVMYNVQKKDPKTGKLIIEGRDITKEHPDNHMSNPQVQQGHIDYEQWRDKQ
ncbi:hypothetical protein UFOVP139_20 [uncultured Caudovirales phage]|uniref:Uncharacterized protein n=1 Tax=uncultured Caudovirales phage TaxID=2100421 RepID=A0A6J5LDY9_9CAUD|nr:hypothetical protein UFOVP139_20 [uncultured Caudovirales phage]